MLQWPNTLQKATQGVEKFILDHDLRAHSPSFQGRQGSKDTLDSGDKRIKQMFDQIPLDQRTEVDQDVW